MERRTGEAWFARVKGSDERSGNYLHFKYRDKFGGGHDVPYGTGIGDVQGMLTELKRQKFKGYLSFEYEHDQDKIPYLKESLAKSIAYFDKTCAELAK